MGIGALPVLAPGEAPPRGATVLVHIGKTGGSSVRVALQGHPVAQDMVVCHITPPPVRPDLRYVLVLRHPVQRALSAFNWRRRIVIEQGKQSERFAGEAEVLRQYDTLNALAHALDTDAGRDAFGRVHHLRENIAFYLDPLRNGVTPDAIVAVLVQERLADDLARVWGITDAGRVNAHGHRTDDSQRHLDDRALRALYAHLAPDFAAIDWLHGIACLDADGHRLLTYRGAA